MSALINNMIKPETAGTTDRRLVALAILAGTLLSFATSGYLPISNNNIYHLPILMGTYDLPQFANDPFVQSLRNFSSGFWLLFANSGLSVEPKLFLTAWLFASRLLFLGACAHLTSSLGYRDTKLLSALVVLLGVSNLMVAEAAGGGGLLLPYFTHSELANATTLFAFSFAISRRYGLCVLMGCVTFFLNAFMAVWLAFPLLMLLGLQLRTGEVDMRTACRSALPGMAGLILLVPVIANILGNEEALQAADFSYQQFLWSFFPDHFFITALTPLTLLKIVALLAILSLTLIRQRAGSSALSAIAIGALGVLVLGILAPLLTDSRSILNLHLIRSFVVLHMLAAISLCLFGLSLCIHPRDRLDVAIGLILIALLLLPSPLWMLAVLPLFLLRVARPWLQRIAERHPRFFKEASYAVLALSLAVLPVRMERKWSYIRYEAEVTQQWVTLGTWAQQNTPADSVFLIMPDEAGDSALGFSYSANRQIWMTEKYGAAVMWTPSYFDIWNARKIPTDATRDARAMVDYAREKGVDYVAAPCDPQMQPAHQQGRLCVYLGGTGN